MKNTKSKILILLYEYILVLVLVLLYTESTVYPELVLFVQVLHLKNEIPVIRV